MEASILKAGFSMSVHIPFDSMSFAERLEVLEMAWDSLPDAFDVLNLI